MAELQSRCKPDPRVNAKLTCFVTATPPPEDHSKSDALYRDLYELTARGVSSLSPVPTEALRVLEGASGDKLIKAPETGTIVSIPPVMNDGIVTSACQMVHPNRPDEFGGLVIADHGDVLGHYPRVDPLSSLEAGADKKTINVGLFQSGAAFRDDQFFELYRRVANGFATRGRNGRCGLMAASTGKHGCWVDVGWQSHEGLHVRPDGERGRPWREPLGIGDYGKVAIAEAPRRRR